MNNIRVCNKWLKDIGYKSINIDKFNGICDNVFNRACDICLDNSNKRKTGIKANNFRNEKEWRERNENIYLIVRNDMVMKIGGTRTGMKNRFKSYLSGYYNSNRKDIEGKEYSGKCSITNANIYNTIENDLMIDDMNRWCFWTWKLPKVKIPIVIFDENIDIEAQTYHVYESIIIDKFKSIIGNNTIL